MNFPAITVLMPAYNAEKYIREAISSVLNQTCTDFELLIVDDGSADNTVAEIKRFTDSRIRLIQQNHQGIATALNNGLHTASGQYIARFDADDICLPDRLEKQLKFLDTDARYVACGGNAEYISASGEHLFDFRCIGYTHEEISQQLYTSCPFIHSAVMYRKAAVLQAGGYSPYAHHFEDYLLWIQLSRYGLYYNFNEQLIRVRINSDSVTIDEKWRSYRFRHLKKAIINRGSITPAEGEELKSIILFQDTRKLKEGAYYALCGKKFLVNNHQPSKARTYFSKAIQTYPFRWDNYAFYLLSYFPQPVISWLHRKNTGKISAL
jgi:glycosyltransferase involved in cell wall biosynthesis